MVTMKSSESCRQVYHKREGTSHVALLGQENLTFGGYHMEQ